MLSYREQCFVEFVQRGDCDEWSHCLGMQPLQDEKLNLNSQSVPRSKHSVGYKNQSVNVV
jgi:hypothetical protein